LNFPTFPWSQAVGQGEQGEASGAREPQEVFGEVTWRKGKSTNCRGFLKWGYPKSWLVYDGNCYYLMDDLGPGKPPFWRFPPNGGTPKCMV